MNLIRLVDVAECPICVSWEDGEKVCQMISSFLDNDQDVTVSFKDVKILAASFLTPAIGDLYEKYPEDKILEKVHYADMDKHVKSYLDWVISDTKEYLNDPDGYEKMVEDVLNNYG